MTNFYDLAYDGDFINPQFDYKSYVWKEQMWMTYKVIPRDVLTLDALRFIARIGVILPPWANFFVGAPNMNTSIHVDEGMNYAINYVWGAEDSDMIWYEPLEGAEPTKHLTTANTPYVSYKLEDVREIQRLRVRGPSLVRVNVPHAVENRENALRYCLSLRSSVRLSWDEITKKLQPCIK